jgi:hypothetical protein
VTQLNDKTHFVADGSSENTEINLKKTVLAACIESIQDYCRVVYDLFPEESQVL